ncbi:hypothetical protein EW093_13920 [Thiospirochaeta perfilievii]|uniref:Flagellar protein FlaG n=1 Tax=Thiospirochaeta perfilievii TaxID=252967 RepID=A0A5C1QGK9_9SPIO|nr:flagellar protein FlaG [Thiospirochaeta perfilievii]QEN05754.1 hypothetical protein EW093_13920 [Thiospirochaeta perfilievii]
MTVITENVIRQDLRESNVRNEKTANVQAKTKISNEDVLTLPEVKIQLTDILKETKLKYSVDEQDNGFIIKVMDKKTDKIIKEIPSHDIQVLRKHFRTHMGVLFNELI